MSKDTLASQAKEVNETRQIVTLLENTQEALRGAQYSNNIFRHQVDELELKRKQDASSIMNLQQKNNQLREQLNYFQNASKQNDTVSTTSVNNSTTPFSNPFLLGGLGLGVLGILLIDEFYHDNKLAISLFKSIKSCIVFTPKACKEFFLPPVKHLRSVLSNSR